MLLIISPAKNLDFESPLPTEKHSNAAMLEDSQILMRDLKKLAPHDLSALMGISDKLGLLNYDRNQAWEMPLVPGGARQAILAFKGDVYLGLDAYQFSADDFEFAQQQLRILSGLYGLLMPLDLVLPYRLEMGTKFNNERGGNLYRFWGDKITDLLNQHLAKSKQKVIVNLASNEYFKAVNKKSLKAEIVTPVFKDWKGDKYKIISFYAKKARGLMSAYSIKNKITDVERLKEFDWAGYRYDETASSDSDWVYLRKESNA
ncbi:MAG: peroxide stress protein YaaA [Alteromonadaceae bacterium]|nr:MAG: peroxide stress protein YaaA [Alteromonadaceae bacterium]